MCVSDFIRNKMKKLQILFFFQCTPVNLFSFNILQLSFAFSQSLLLYLSLYISFFFQLSLSLFQYTSLKSFYTWLVILIFIHSSIKAVSLFHILAHQIQYLVNYRFILVKKVFCQKMFGVLFCKRCID